MSHSARSTRPACRQPPTHLPTCAVVALQHPGRLALAKALLLLAVVLALGLPVGAQLGDGRDGHHSGRHTGALRPGTAAVRVFWGGGADNRACLVWGVRGSGGRAWLRQTAWNRARVPRYAHCRGGWITSGAAGYIGRLHRVPAACAPLAGLSAEVALGHELGAALAKLGLRTAVRFVRACGRAGTWWA